MTVLIADDDALMRRLLRRIVEGLGWRCVSAANARELEACAAKERPDAVISDVDLGDGDGIALCAGLRRRCPGMPIVIVTGSPAAADAARAAGFAVVLDKPFATELLKSILRRLLQGGGA